jgi:putative glutamine amidotransferase
VTHIPVVLVTGSTEIVDRRSHAYVEEAYTNALVAAGLLPWVLPPIAPAIAIRALDHVEGLVLTGGEDIGAHWFNDVPHPAAGAPHDARDAYEIALSRAAYERRLPTLALCRGAHLINVALGGSLIQDIPSQRPEIAHPRSKYRTERVHAVELDRQSRLASIFGASTVGANSFHHQAIDRLAAPLCIAGRSPDGIIEAFESTAHDWWMMAVQWHPEDLTETEEDWDRRLFTAFADELRARHDTNE